MNKTMTGKLIKLLPFKEVVLGFVFFVIQGFVKLSLVPKQSPMSRLPVVEVNPSLQFIYFICGGLGMACMLLASLKYYRAIKVSRKKL